MVHPNPRTRSTKSLQPVIDNGQPINHASQVGASCPVPGTTNLLLRSTCGWKRRDTSANPYAAHCSVRDGMVWHLTRPGSSNEVSYKPLLSLFRHETCLLDRWAPACCVSGVDRHQSPKIERISALSPRYSVYWVAIRVLRTEK